MSPVELPEPVTRCLWDTDLGSVRWETARDAILGRVRVHGDWDALRGLRKTAGDDAIRAWLVATCARRLSRRQIRFWQLLLDLPEAQVAEWLALPGRTVWDE